MHQARDYQIEMLESGKTEAAFVAHVSDPDNFYIHLSSSTDTLDSIGATLTSQSQGVEDHVWHLGDPCAAMFDDQWSRGRVTGTPHKRDHVEVTFVDFGNKEYLTKKDIAPISPDMLTTPVLSHHCCLEGVICPDNFWAPEFIAKFEDLVMDKELTVHIVSYDELQDVYHLLLFDENQGLINKQFAKISGSDFVETASVSNGVGQIASGPAQSSGPKFSSQSSLPRVDQQLGDKVHISIRYMPSPSEWWCLQKTYEDSLEYLKKQMAQTYSNMGPGDCALRDLRPGMLCAAFSPSENCWHRASIEQVMGASVSLIALDFGRRGTVPANALKDLKEEFRKLPALAIYCCLHGVVPESGVWTNNATGLFGELVENRYFTGTVMAKDPDGRLHMSLMDCVNNTNVSTTFLEKCPEATRGAPPPLHQDAAVDLPKYPALNIPSGSRKEVFLSWVNTPGDFYVHLAENQPDLDAISSGLELYYYSSKAQPARNVRVGSMVVAKFSEDNEWYRAVVRSLTDTSAAVVFVDFGNTDEVPTDSLQQLAPEFTTAPAQAVRCSLFGVRPLTQGSTWSGDAKDFLDNLTEKGAVCLFLSRRGLAYEVDLRVDSKNIAKEMIALAVVRASTPEAPAAVAGLTRMVMYTRVDPSGGRPVKAYMAFIQSVESFYMQLADRMEELDRLMEQMQTYYEAGKGKPITSFMTGMPCAAKYEEDSQWYRAEVRSYTLRDVDVFFVDYGNTQSSPKTSVFMLEPEFVSCLEALALHCQLRVVESKNAKAQYDQFNDWTEDQELEMVVKGKEGSKLLVDLLKKGVSLTEELTGWHRVKAAMEKLPSCYTPGKVSPGQTVSAFASFIESPARFWVQLAGCDDELTSLVRILSGHYSSGSEPTLSSPSPGQPCVALYELDEQWYRASVISIHGTQIKVQFVDYGNTELVDRQNIKSISPGFLSAPLLAVECCLDGFQSCAMADDDVTFMESLVSSQELSVTFRGPKNVLVRVGDMDIAQALQDKGLGPQQQKASQAQSLSQSSSRVSSPPSGGSPHLSQSGYSPTGPLLKFKAAVPPSGSAEGIISHVDEESGMIYIQLLSSESQLQQLSFKLQSSFGSGGSPLQGSPVTGMACCAKFCMDQCWYRAVVEQVKGAQVQVQFVDYGNSDTVPMSTLKSATPDLMNSPKHAFVCKLKGLKAWTAHTYKALCRCGLDQQLNVRFVTSSSPFEIQASANGQDLLQMMFKPPVPSPQVSPPKASFDSRSDHRDSRNSRQAGPQPTRQNGFGNTGQSYNKRPGQQSYGSTQAEEDSWIEAKPRNKAQYASPESPVQTVEQVFQPQVVPAGEQAAYISNVAEDGTFAVQLVTDITAVDEMTSKVENCPSLRHPSPIVGAACGAQYSADRAWYRGIILSVSGASAHVVFVDYGNEEMCQLNALKPLPAHLLTPPLAYHCQMGGIIPTAEQREALRLAGEKALFFTFREGTCNPYDVSVRDEKGTSLIETILRPTAISQPTVPSKMVHATVCHVGQDGHFYLQLNSELDAIDDFRFDIQTVCETHTEKLTSFDDGQFCFAQFSEDDAWYRAVIVGSSGDKATVLFVDYGNTDIADKDGLFVIPPSFMIKPAYAYDCRIPGVKKWKEGQKQKFEAMTEDKMMNARFLTSEPPYEVQLTRDIGLELEEEAETTENEKLANEPAENVELIKNEESPEEPAEHFKLAEETASGELVEDAGRPTEMVQEPSEDAEQFYNVEEGTEEVEASGRDPQKLAEAVVSEEEFSDVRESLESSMPDEDTKGADPSKATVLEYPAQMPPALDACIVSHLNEDGTFYLQLVSEDESREKISDRLQDECESADSKTVVCPSVKHACCAKFSDDDAWYRAVIEKVADKKVEVLFVDFGNMDDIAVEDLRELSAESLQVPPLAYKCVLEDCDTELVNNKLEEATLDQTLTVTFSTTETIPYSVSLKLEDGTNISTVLTKSVEQASSFLQSADESGAAQHRVEEVCAEDRKSVALVQGQRVRVMVSDITSPSLFYVQPDNNSSALDEMSDFMFEHFSSLAEEDGTIANIAQGQLCACQFGEDRSWYRAVVRSLDSEADRCSLFYVDYGNSDCVPKASVREMPVEFKAMPWQCVSCSLAGVSCQQEWSQEVKAAFEDMLANKSVTAEVLSGDGVNTPYLVHVFNQDKSVAESLRDLNLPGVEAAEMPSPSSATQALAADSSPAAEQDKLSLENLSEETVEGGLAEKEDTEKEAIEDFEESEQEFSRHLHECSAQETVDDLDESEQEFSRQLQACTARMESTMVEEVRAARQNANSTTWEEPSAIVSREEEPGKEEEEDFEDAVEAEQDSAEEDGNVSEDLQVACGCVSDWLAELEWLDIHVCVAVSSSEFWCQLPSARSTLAGTTLGIERARASDTVKNVKVGNLYLVCDPPQTNYRGRVLSDCDESGRALVLKLDYGTEERVATKCLYPLAKHQLELPAQAFCCCLGDAEEVGATHEWLDSLITRGEAVDLDLQIKVVGRKPNGIPLVDVQERPGSTLPSSSQEALAGEEGSEGDISASGKQAGDEVSVETLEFSHPVLQSTILGDTLSQSHMEKCEGGDNDYMVHSLKEFTDYEVTIAPGGEPNSFYAVKTSAKDVLESVADEIEEEVKEKGETAAEGELLVVNSPCLVLDEDTSKWVRGQVKSIGDRLKVLCVDRGVVVEAGRESVRDLPPRLMDTPAQAMLCCLADVVPVDSHWCDAALSLFTDFIGIGPLKLTAYGLCEEGKAYRVTLCDESQAEGSLTISVVGVESSINRTLVELGYAEAVAGSPLEVALQVERTINDSDKIEQMETSFTERSLLRENSLGDEEEEESDVEDNTEQERDAIQASGDAPSMATESDEESKCLSPADARLNKNILATRWWGGGDTAGERSATSNMTDISSVVTVYTSPAQSKEGGLSSVVSSPLFQEGDSGSYESLGGMVRYVVGAEGSEETMEESVSAEGLPDMGEGGNTQGFVVDADAASDVPAVGDSSSVNTCSGSAQGIDGQYAVNRVYSECWYNNPTQGSDVTSYPAASSPGRSELVGFGERSDAHEPKEDHADFLGFSQGRIRSEVAHGGQKVAEFQGKEIKHRNVTLGGEDEVKEAFAEKEVGAEKPEAEDMTEPSEDNNQKTLVQPVSSATEETALEQILDETEHYLLDTALNLVVEEIESSPQKTNQRMVKTDGEEIMRPNKDQSETAAGERSTSVTERCVGNILDTLLTKVEISSAPKADQGTGEIDSGEIVLRPETKETESEVNVAGNNSVTLDTVVEVTPKTCQQGGTVDMGKEGTKQDQIKMVDAESWAEKNKKEEKCRERRRKDKFSLALAQQCDDKEGAGRETEEQQKVSAYCESSKHLFEDDGYSLAVAEQYDDKEGASRDTPEQQKVLAYCESSKHLFEDNGYSPAEQYDDKEGASRDTPEQQKVLAYCESSKHLFEDDGYSPAEQYDDKEGASHETREQQKVLAYCESSKHLFEDDGYSLDDKEGASRDTPEQQKVLAYCESSKHLFEDDSYSLDDKEGASRDTPEQQKVLAYCESSKHLFEDDGYQPAPYISPSHCPLPSSSDDSLDSSAMQARTAASPIIDAVRTECPPSRLAPQTADQDHSVVSSEAHSVLQEQEDTCLQSDGKQGDTCLQSNRKPESSTDTTNLNSGVAEDPTNHEAHSEELSASLSGDGSDSMEELAAVLESMAIQEMEQHREEEDEQRQELAQMIDELGKTMDVEDPSHIDHHVKDSGLLIYPQGGNVQERHIKDSDPSTFTPGDHKTVAKLQVDKDAALQEEDVLLQTNTTKAENSPDVSSAAAEKSTAAPVGENVSPTTESVEVCPIVKRPETSDSVSEGTEVSSAVEEKLVNRDTKVANLEDFVISAERPEGALEERPEDCGFLAEKPEDIVTDRPQDTLEERPKDTDTVTDRPQDTVEERPKGTDTVTDHPEDTLEERPKDTDAVTDRPQDTVEERPKDTDTVTDRPEDTLEKRPKDTDTVTDRPEDTLEERPKDTDTVTDRPEDTVEKRPKDTDTVTDRPEDTLEERPKDTDTVTDRPEDTVEERPKDTDTVTDRPEERPKGTNKVTDRPEDTLEERPKDTDAVADRLEERPKDTDTVTDRPEERPKDTDTVTDRPEERPKDTDAVADRLEDSLEERPKDTVEVRPDTVIIRPENAVTDRAKDTDILTYRTENTTTEDNDTTTERTEDTTTEDNDTTTERTEDTTTEDTDNATERTEDTTTEDTDNATERTEDTTTEDTDNATERTEDTTTEDTDNATERTEDTTTEDTDNATERTEDTTTEDTDNATERTEDTTTEDTDNATERTEDTTTEDTDNATERTEDTTTEDTDNATERTEDTTTERTEDTTTERTEDTTTEDTDTTTDRTEDADTVTDTNTDTMADRPEDDDDDDEVDTTEEGSEFDNMADLSGAGDSMAEMTERDKTRMRVFEASKITMKPEGAGEAMAEVDPRDNMSEILTATMADTGAGEAMVDVNEALKALAEMSKAGDEMAEMKKMDDLTTDTPEGDNGVKEKSESVESSKTRLASRDLCVGKSQIKVGAGEARGKNQGDGDGSRDTAETSSMSATLAEERDTARVRVLPGTDAKDKTSHGTSSRRTDSEKDNLKGSVPDSAAVAREETLVTPSPSQGEDVTTSEQSVQNGGHSVAGFDQHIPSEDRTSDPSSGKKQTAGPE